MSGPILRTKRLKILEPLQDANSDEILVFNSETKEVSSLPKESVFDADNIKTEIAIDAPVDPTAEGFADAINALPLFTIDGKTIPTFKAVTTGENPVVYYVELLNLGKGSYGLTGTQLTAQNIRLTSTEPTATDIETLSTTQTIDLGANAVDPIETVLNALVIPVTIQDASTGYTILKLEVSGIVNSYLWIGVTGTYGAGQLQATESDFQQLSNDVPEPKKATATKFGSVKTDVTKPNPTVYVKETVDNLLAGKANTFTEIKTITGIAYTPILSDVTKELLYEGTLPMTITIPNNSTEPFPAGTSFYTLGTNTGIVSASAAAGVTLKYKAGMSLSAVQNEIRKYTKQGVNTWLVDGSVSAVGALSYKTYFVNSISGNNAGGVYQDSSKPFATLDYVLGLIGSNDNIKIWIQDSATYVLNGLIPSNKSIEFYSETSPTITFASNTTVGSIYTNSSNNSILKFNIPLGTILLTPNGSGAVDSVWFRMDSGSLQINCNNMTLGSKFYVEQLAHLDLNVKDTLIINNRFITRLWMSNYFNLHVSFIYINKISSTTASKMFDNLVTGDATKSKMDITINEIVSTSTFSIIPSASIRINLTLGQTVTVSTAGSSSLVGLQPLLYVFFNNTTLTGNTNFPGSGGILSGTVTIVNANYVFDATGGTTVLKQLFMTNNSNSGAGLFRYSLSSKWIIIDSTIIIGNSAEYLAYMNGGVNLDFTGISAVISFYGTCVIKHATNNFELVYLRSLSNYPLFEVHGILKTNGLMQSNPSTTMTITNKTPNSY